MEWKDIRQHFPEQWVLVEAMKARTEGVNRIVESLSVVEVSSDSATAWRHYKQLHRASPTREFYIAHTSREELEITEFRWLGIRPQLDESTMMKTRITSQL